MIAAPPGAPASSDQDSVLAGTSTSVAVTVKVRAVSSSTVRLPVLVTTGAVFTSFTVIVIVTASSRAGVPLSVARIVTG